MSREMVLNLVLSVVKFLGLVLFLYYVFIGMGIEEGKAVIEALIIASAIITLVVLYLFGRTWKKELGMR